MNQGQQDALGGKEGADGGKSPQASCESATPSEYDVSENEAMYYDTLAFGQGESPEKPYPEAIAHRRNIMSNFQPSLLAAAKGWAENQEPFFSTVEEWWRAVIVVSYDPHGITAEGESISKQLRAEISKWKDAEEMRQWEQKFEVVKAFQHAEWQAKEANYNADALFGNDRSEVDASKISAGSQQSTGASSRPWPGFRSRVSSHPSGMTLREFVDTYGERAMKEGYGPF